MRPSATSATSTSARCGAGERAHDADVDRAAVGRAERDAGETVGQQHAARTGARKLEHLAARQAARVEIVLVHVVLLLENLRVVFPHAERT